MEKTKFFQRYGDRLVKVNNDDTETGDFMLFCPEESYTAKDYLDKGYSVASVFEVENAEDNIELDNDTSPSPYKIGFIIIK
jgi:hypothetical protein